MPRQQPLQAPARPRASRGRRLRTGRAGTGAEAAGRDGSGASASGPTPPAAASQRACAAGSPARSPEPRARACAEPPGGPRGAGPGLGSLGFRG